MFDFWCTRRSGLKITVCIHLHSFVGAKEDVSDCAGLEDIRGRTEEVIVAEATDNT